MSRSGPARLDYLWPVDPERDGRRRALARAGRRRQVLEALEFERGRETVLVEQLEHTLAEADGAGLDEAIFAGMEPEQVEIVRGVLHGPSEDEQDDWTERTGKTLSGGLSGL